MKDEGGRMTQILRADWVAPMDQPLIREGAVAFADGRILGVGSAAEVCRAHPEAQIHDLGDSVLLPGLINAHTHLELSSCTAGASPGGSFAQWILSIRERMQNPDAAASTRMGIEQCLRFGVTCVGDITQRPAATRQALSASPLRAVSFGEVLGLGAFRHRFDELFPQAVDPQYTSAKLKIGITPHAPYTVDMAGYRVCLRCAREHQLPLMTHLAESPDETSFLESSSGPFRWAWEQLGTWQDGVQTFAGGPIRFAREVGLLDDPTLLAHVNYCDDVELDILAAGRASVVYCPRTHRYFGHPPHRWREMLDRGINVAVGTDSCASSPDLNIVDDLRLLHKIAPEMGVESLWEMVTIRGARALGCGNPIGSITPDKRADFVVFRVSTDQPLGEVLDSAVLPTSTWIEGEQCH